MTKLEDGNSFLLSYLGVWRLAVDLRYQRSPKRFGSALVVDAVRRCCSSDIAAVGLCVEAKTPELMNFYNHLGFEEYDKQKAFLRFPRVQFK